MLVVLTDIRNWTRAASYGSVKALLEEALPDAKSRAAYQMLDGINTTRQIQAACKMSPNVLSALAERCTAAGLMDLKDDRKRVRLFDLSDFGLIDNEMQPTKRVRK